MDAREQNRTEQNRTEKGFSEDVNDWNRRKIIILIPLLVLHLSALAQFLPAIIPNKIFPKPIINQLIPPPVIHPPGAIPYSGLYPGTTFYNNRSNGSCYNYTENFDIRDAAMEEINIWAIEFNDITGYPASIAYEVTDLVGNLKFRGTKPVGGDVLNLKVGLYKDNTSNFHIVVAYSVPATVSEIHLADYVIDPFAGLNLISDNVIQLGPGSSAQNIDLDCHDLSAFVVVWEMKGAGIFAKAYDYGPAGIGASAPVQLIAPGSYLRIPQVALSRSSSLPLGETRVHVAFVDSAFTPTNSSIRKIFLNFNALLSGAATSFFEDEIMLPGKMGNQWDDFNLHLDAPDHVSTFTPTDWAYTYYDHDNNNIKVRMSSQSLVPNYQSFVVNNGSIPIAGSVGAKFLDNITNASNNFPSLSYLPDGSAVYVAWHTTYDPGFPAYPLPNMNPYHYSAESQGYISVILNNNGELNTDAYNHVDEDYLNNRIGQGIDPVMPDATSRPKICLSKHNEASHLHLVFSGHAYGNYLIWNWGASAFGSEYFENSPFVFASPARIHSPIIPPPAVVQSGFNYIDYLMDGRLLNGTSSYIASKQVAWYPAASPLFRTIGTNASHKGNIMVNLANNPFDEHHVVQLRSTEHDALFHMQLVDMLGRTIINATGNMDQLNKHLKFMNLNTMSKGQYILKLRSNAFQQQFKVQYL